MNQVDRAGGYGQVILPSGDDGVSVPTPLVRGDGTPRDVPRPPREEAPFDRAGRDSSERSTDGPSVAVRAAGTVSAASGTYPDSAQALLGQDAWEGIRRGQRTLTEGMSAAAAVGPIDAARLDAMVSQVLVGLCE